MRPIQPAPRASSNGRSRCTDGFKRARHGENPAPARAWPDRARESVGTRACWGSWALARAGGHLDSFGVAPEALEAVEEPRLGLEHMHDEIEVVDEHPFGSVG